MIVPRFVEDVASWCSASILKIEIDGRDEVLARLRRHDLKLALHAAAAVDQHLSIAGLSAKVFVVILFEAALADHVAGTKTLFLVFVFFELFRADLADVTEDVRERRAQADKTAAAAVRREARETRANAIRPR